MTDTQTRGHEADFISMMEYAADLAKSGVRVFPGGPGTFWAGYLYGTLMRRPTFYLEPPAAQEIQHVLWQGRAAIASYLLEPDASHQANTWLYICTDHAYSLERRSSEMRRNVRRGLKELTISFLTSDQVLAHGAQAFCDTQRRLGLSDGTPERFHQHIMSAAELPEYVYLGAWKDNQLAAFLSIIEVDDWVEIEGTFSMDALRRYKPNDTLLYHALSHYLVDRRCRLVFNGLSPTHAASNAAGLHVFKTKVGFKARPVHRAFVPHPLLHPFVNRLTLWSVNRALRFWPEDRRLQKAGGMLACMLGDTRMLHIAAGSTSEE